VLNSAVSRIHGADRSGRQHALASKRGIDHHRRCRTSQTEQGVYDLIPAGANGNDIVGRFA
jgi:hypothetical protein